MENTVNQEEKKDNKKRFLILFILLGVLTVFSVFSGYLAFVKSPEKIEKLTVESDNQKTRAEKLKGEIDKVSSMLETIGFEAGAEGMENLTEEHLAIRKEVEEKKKNLKHLQDKMNELIALSKGDATDADSFVDAYRKLKAAHWKLNNEVGKLRRRNKELMAENEKLNTENSSLKEEVEKQRQNTEMLVEEREMLKMKVEKAAALNVHELNADGIRIVRSGREKISSSARKAEKIRVGFTLPKNEVTNPGTKTVYLVVTGPDKMVITDGGSNFMYEGKNIAYSVKDQVEYNNESKDMVMYAKNLFKSELDPGNYQIDIYCEGAKIGKTVLFLK